MKKNVYIVALLLILTTNIELSSLGWIKTNGPYGADISKVLIDPRSNQIYIATKSDGVYSSIDNGNFWISMHSGDLQNSTWVNDIILDTTSNTLYIATDSIGVLRKQGSNDWEKIETGLPLNGAGTNQMPLSSIYKLQNKNLLAGTYGIVSKGLYKSVKDGEPWTQIFEGDLTNSEKIYCITQTSTGKILLGTSNGVLQGTSEAKGWARKGANGTSVYSFKKSNDGLTIMAGTSKGVYASSNNGDTWNAQSSGIGTDKKVISLAYHKDGYFIAGTEKNGFWNCSKSGFVWTPFNTGLESKKIQSVATNNKGEIFAGTNFAFYYLKNITDINDTWKLRINGLGLRTVNGFAMLANRGTVLAATDLGIYRTTNNGDAWVQLNQGLDSLDNLNVNALVIAKNGYIFAGKNGDGLFYSTNSGDYWKKVSNPGGIDAVSTINTLDTNTTDNTIYAGTNLKGVYKSLDQSGTDWLQMSGEDYLEDRNILSFLVADNDDLFAGTDDNGLYKKEPSGNWTKKTNISGSIVRTIAFDGISGMLYVATNIGLFGSSSYGNSFAKFDGLGLVAEIEDMIVGANGNVYCSQLWRKGVYLSNDGGASFQQLRHPSLDLVLTKALDINGTGFIYAGTAKGGCFRSDSSTSNNILVLNTDKKDTIFAQQGDKINFKIDINNYSGAPIADVEVKITNDMKPAFDAVVATNGQGTVNYEITIPSDLVDGLYKFSFVGTKEPFLDSELKEIFIDVERKKIFLDVTPGSLVSMDVGDEVYTIIAKDKNNIPLPNIKIDIEDKLTPKNDTKTTDANGTATYQVIVGLQHPADTYDVNFSATDPNSEYQPSDVVLRQIKVQHNAIVIDGDIDVCENELFVYKTVADSKKAFTWSVTGGTNVGPITLDSIQIMWGSAGTGKLTLSQKIIADNLTTERTIDVTIHAKDVVTFNDPPALCIGEQLDLSTLDPNPTTGGVWSGPGVVGNTFDSQLVGAGNHDLTYTVTSQYNDKCESSLVKSITVNPKPGVKLVPFANKCQSPYPFELTGGTPAGGTYTCNNNTIVGTQYYPNNAGVDTIFYNFLDTDTGCDSTAKMAIVINDAPDVNWIGTTKNVCVSDADYDLSKQVSDSCTFTGPFVNGNIFKATDAQVGNTYTIHYTTKTINSFGCQGKDSVDLVVIDVPKEPTITIDADSIELSSSYPNNNQWYKDGIILTGETKQIYKPDSSGDFQVTYTDPSTGCESFKSKSQSFVPKKITGTITIADKFADKIKPGEIVDIYINLSDRGNFDSKLKIDSISAELRYNSTLLYPIGIPVDKMFLDTNKQERVIYINAHITDNTEIIEFEFEATIGNAISTALYLDNIKTFSENVLYDNQITVINNTIEILVPSRGDDGARLYGISKGGGIIQIKPNPADETVELSIVTNPEEEFKLLLTDVNGQVIKTIYQGKSESGNFSGIMNTDGLIPGVYFVIYQSPWEKNANKLFIIR